MMSIDPRQKFQRILKIMLYIILHSSKTVLLFFFLIIILEDDYCDNDVMTITGELLVEHRNDEHIERDFISCVNHA